MKAAVERIDGGKATLAELRRAGIDALVPAFSAHVDRCARQVSVDQEAHREMRLMRVKTSGSHGRRRLKRIGTCSGGFQD